MKTNVNGDFPICSSVPLKSQMPYKCRALWCLIEGRGIGKVEGSGKIPKTKLAGGWNKRGGRGWQKIPLNLLDFFLFIFSKHQYFQIQKYVPDHLLTEYKYKQISKKRTNKYVVIHIYGCEVTGNEYESDSFDVTLSNNGTQTNFVYIIKV